MAARISCEDCRCRPSPPPSPRGRGDEKPTQERGEGDRVETHLKGKTVLVTEALHHFGTPMALAFAREGANLFLATLSDHEPLEHTARAAASLGVKVVTDVCD